MSCILGAKRLYFAAMVRPASLSTLDHRATRLLAGLLLRP
jgi:hypothetical protein